MKNGLKKLLVLLLAICTIAVLSACGDEVNTTVNSGDTNDQPSDVSSNTDPAPTIPDDDETSGSGTNTDDGTVDSLPSGGDPSDPSADDIF